MQIDVIVLVVANVDILEKDRTCRSAQTGGQ